MSCALGTSAVMVKMHLEGKLPLNTQFVHEGITGTQFFGKLIQETTVRTTITFLKFISDFCHFISQRWATIELLFLKYLVVHGLLKFAI